MEKEKNKGFAAAFSERIPIAGPSITEVEINCVIDAVKNGWYNNAFEHILRFEEAFSNAVDRKYAVSLPSCTAGIHLALSALNIGPGDEVIVPDCTWIASCAPVNYVGATPVFADIDKNTWCISGNSIEDCVSSNTKAVIAVNLYGNMPDWDDILRIARKYNLFIIEDAAESIGSLYRGRPAGSFGDCSVFSFHGSKTLTTGEGGMFVCNDKKMYDRINKLRDHGRVPGDVMFNNDEIGYKYKMSPIQAALGHAQLSRLSELVAMKRRIFSWYKERTAAIEEITLNPDSDNVFNSYWMSTAILNASTQLNKTILIPMLRDSGIDVRPFFNPLSLIPAYSRTAQAKAARERNHVAHSISPWGINLPSSLVMTESDTDRVVTVLLELIQKKL
ncbi:DegT/DnrJ/EryC1/StrS family aminotransferase [Methylobacterium sp. NEAU 140]|uniref:DegT/DnrJ/EryC1/StrS family aminotransferase n=1 Tax=Methylobacterium sp. NEAU 140 TaxID=3064945 RepID=UPI002735C4CE|nr:DegT/DnrJ/EryC1/StrS family aminotransferase [Methylobacterium sp. NEAU 140]MDP4026014.1 DegT/DnrJ/EryC1/StrS family aminotransferase [Methylobacterium sp. NEAU 140]